MFKLTLFYYFFKLTINRNTNILDKQYWFDDIILHKCINSIPRILSKNSFVEKYFDKWPWHDVLFWTSWWKEVHWTAVHLWGGAMPQRVPLVAINCPHMGGGHHWAWLGSYFVLFLLSFSYHFMLLSECCLNRGSILPKMCMNTPCAS